MNLRNGRIDRRFLVIIERAGDNFSAYCPDLPGCIATGSTRKETELDMHEALQFHIEGLLEEGETVPEPTSEAEYMFVA